jgi:hypothetical protein
MLQKKTPFNQHIVTAKVERLKNTMLYQVMVGVDHTNYCSKHAADDKKLLDALNDYLNAQQRK